MAQATLELVTRSRRSPFVSHQHILNSHAWWYVAEVLGKDMLNLTRDGTSEPFTLYVADSVEPDPGDTTSA